MLERIEYKNVIAQRLSPLKLPSDFELRRRLKTHVIVLSNIHSLFSFLSTLLHEILKAVAENPWGHKWHDSTDDSKKNAC